MTMTRVEQRLSDAKERGYLIVSQAESETRVRNAWFDWSELHQQPYITVIERRQYAEVTADAIAMRSRPTEHQCQRHREIVKQYAEPGSYVFLGPVFMGASKIRKDRAGAYARELHVLLTGAMES